MLRVANKTNDAFRKKAIQAGYNDQEIQSYIKNRSASRQTAQPQQSNSGGGFEPSSLIQESGSLAGALGGGAIGAGIGTSILPVIGTGIGGLIGAGIGGFGGSLFGGAAETKVRDGEAQFKFKDAALDGVLSAGPIKLGAIGAQGAKAVARGAGKQGIKEALESGANFTFRGALGKGAKESGKNLAIRPLGLTKGQKTSIRTSAGGDLSASDALAKFNVNSLEDVGSEIAKRQTAFDEIVGGINRKFTKTEIQKSFSDAYTPLLNGNLGQQAIGQRLKQESDELIKRIPTGGLSGTKLNEERKGFQALAKRFGDNPTLSDTNEAARSVTSGLLRESGEGLEEVGKDLSVLRTTQEAAKKNLESGTGRSGLRASDLIAGGPAGIAGGLPAALGAAIAARAAATPTAARIFSKGATVAGKALDNSASRAVAPLGRALQSGVNTNLVGLGSSLGGQSSGQNPNIVNTDMTTSDTTAQPISDNILGSNISQNQQQANTIDVQGIAQQLIAKGASIDEVQQVIAELTTINSIQDGSYFLPEVEEQKALSGDTAKLLANVDTGLSQIGRLRDLIGPGGEIPKATAIPGAGLGGGFGDRILGTTEIESVRGNLADILGRIRSGGAINDQELVSFNEQVPQTFDSAENVERKLATLEQMFALISNRVNPRQGGL
jgi:hypothetical protein